MKRYLIPLALFVVLAGFLFVGLGLNPREVPSPLVNKPAPAFVLPRLDNPAVQVAAEQLKGQVWVLNVFASWCTPCLTEHPLVTQLARESGIKLIGLNYKDKTEDAKTWLARHGNPYATVIVDRDGRVGIDYGVYGVPETFVVDKEGVIRFKQIGPITPEALRDKIVPLVRKLK
ncbi:MAG: DsbE family thiol:disulfide interchange protein [Rubrivivax sp.]|nr:DsbE family thiol:disulfide interchange protein [Rubrivivax sp.]